MGLYNFLGCPSANSTPPVPSRRSLTSTSLLAPPGAPLRLARYSLRLSICAMMKRDIPLNHSQNMSTSPPSQGVETVGHYYFLGCPSATKQERERADPTGGAKRPFVATTHLSYHACRILTHHPSSSPLPLSRYARDLNRKKQELARARGHKGKDGA
eukprot:CAMPEP_0118856602 /NCGR_PEP_ID=MMETSP1163-20130328/4015_1 /TAXON_ID=124430 /ORGANISM="Phaeomonas parva, Strain CCMP2877" /LENGTH=156 /DNA_ID=CAMNT_0006789733 /DNA_START=308 /DNA_END=774 /DNA_ORIENTATION=-